MSDLNIYSNAFLDEKRNTGDLPADQFIQYVFEDIDRKNELNNWLRSLTTNQDLDKLPEAYAGHPLFSSVAHLPAWSNKQLMKAGETFFARHAEAVMNLLGLLSLPYCYTAADGAMVLYLSERMNANPEKRLLETAEFVWDVMAPGAFEKEGSGFCSILKIRLMHAAARYYTLKSGKWDNSFGTPINQEDMSGTNLSFSFIVVRGLRKLGFTVGYEEQQAYMHLWNVIGYLLGLHEDLLPQSGRQVLNLEEMIRRRQFKASAHGQALTSSLIEYFNAVAKEAILPGKEVVQLMRYLLDNNVADMLGLETTELPLSKIRLIKIANSLSELRIKSIRASYQDQYYKFRKKLPVAG